MFLITCIIIFECAEYGRVLKGEAQGMGEFVRPGGGFYDILKKTLFILTVHVVNRLLRENQKTIPNFISGKKLLKNVTLQILNFIPIS